MAKYNPTTSYCAGRLAFNDGRARCLYAPRTPDRVDWVTGWMDAWRETFQAARDGASSTEERQVLIRYRSDMRDQNNLFTIPPKTGRT